MKVTAGAPKVATTATFPTGSGSAAVASFYIPVVTDTVRMEIVSTHSGAKAHFGLRSLEVYSSKG